MRSFIVFILSIALTPQIANGTEKRCGWIINPTPANWSLKDSDGEWLMSAQGGYAAQDMENMPDMTTNGWVRTNGYYGYGCGCLSVDTNIDKPSHPVFWGRIKRIYSAKPVPLRQCRADKQLPKP